MTQLTFNNQQLLFVGVPMESSDYEIIDRYKPIGIIDDKFNIILGTIQKSNGQVTTSISDEVLGYLVQNDDHIGCSWTWVDGFCACLEAKGLTLQEGEKKAVRM